MLVYQWPFLGVLTQSLLDSPHKRQRSWSLAYLQAMGYETAGVAGWIKVEEDVENLTDSNLRLISSPLAIVILKKNHHHHPNFSMAFNLIQQSSFKWLNGCYLLLPSILEEGELLVAGCDQFVRHFVDTFTHICSYLPFVQIKRGSLKHLFVQFSAWVYRGWEEGSYSRKLQRMLGWGESWRSEVHHLCIWWLIIMVCKNSLACVNFAFKTLCKWIAACRSKECCYFSPLQKNLH